MRLSRKAFLTGLSSFVVTGRAAAQAFLASAQNAITLPSAVDLNGNAPPGNSFIIDNAAAGAVVGALSTVGGTSPYTYTVTDNTKFTTSGSDLTRSNTGTLTAGTPESVDVQTTDANGHSFTTTSPFSVAVNSHTGATTLFIFTLVNTSGSTQAAHSVTQLIGFPFKKGDVPTGTWPQFQLSDTTAVPCTLLNALATYWSDGSLKFVPAMLSVPVSIAGNGSLQITCLNGGSLPSASPRALADFSNGITPQVQVDGLDNLSGTWTFSLPQAISANIQILAYGNGAAGAVWRVRANARQSNADHGQLICDFYIASLANADGSLKGLRILGKVKLPYYDSAVTKNWMSFSRFQLCSDNSGTVIRDLFGSMFGASKAYTFTWSSGSTFNATHGYSLLNGGDGGYCTRLTTTGTLPTGLALNTSYFIGCVQSSSHVQFGTNSSVAVNNGSFVSSTNNGSGTHTATPYPFLAYFGALFTAQSVGTPDFVQGAGSDSSDTAIIHQINHSYWLSSKLIPSFDLSVTSVSSNSSTTYWPNCRGLAYRGIGTAGDRDDLGLLSAWYARHFYTQAAVDYQLVKVTGLVGGSFSVGIENSSTLTYTCLNNGHNGAGTTYSGMPAPVPKFRFAAVGISSSSFGFTDTTNPNVQIAGFSAQNLAHMPQWNYYAYLLTGEPWHFDCLCEHALNGPQNYDGVTATAVISSSGFNLQNVNGAVRNVTVGANPTRYGINICHTEERQDAWALALMTGASALMPPSHPACASYAQYFSDLNADTFLAAIDVQNALTANSVTYAATNGLWWTTPNYFFSVPFMSGYWLAAATLAATATENANAITAVQNHCTWFDHVVSVWTGWVIPTEQFIMKQTWHVGDPINSSDAEVGFLAGNIQWTSGGHFNIHSYPYSNWTIANGDKIFWTSNDENIFHQTPAGFSNFGNGYFIVNANSGTGVFDLSATLGGSPIALTDTYSGTVNQIYMAPGGTPPSTGTLGANAGNSSTGYLAEVLHALYYATAAGVTVSGATTTDLQTRETSAGYTFSSNPKYAFKNTFVQ